MNKIVTFTIFVLFFYSAHSMQTETATIQKPKKSAVVKQVRFQEKNMRLLFRKDEKVATLDVHAQLLASPNIANKQELTSILKKTELLTLPVIAKPISYWELTKSGGKIVWYAALVSLITVKHTGCYLATILFEPCQKRHRPKKVLPVIEDQYKSA